MEADDTATEVLHDLFNDACGAMTQRIVRARKEDGDTRNDGYYRLATTPTALMGLLAELAEGEGARVTADNVGRAFPHVEYVTMADHEATTAEAAQDMSDNNPALVQMYMGDCFFRDLIEATQEHIEQTGDASSFVGLFMATKQHAKDEPLRMDHVIWTFVAAPDEVLRAMKTKAAAAADVETKALDDGEAPNDGDGEACAI